MMEMVTNPNRDRPGAPASPATASPARPAPRSASWAGVYDGSTTVSFAGFAPADQPRFLVYVVVQNNRNGLGGGATAGPAFKKIMSYLLQKYAVPPTGTKPAHIPVTW